MVYSACFGTALISIEALPVGLNFEFLKAPASPQELVGDTPPHHQ